MTERYRLALDAGLGAQTFPCVHSMSQQTVESEAERHSRGAA